MSERWRFLGRALCAIGLLVVLGGPGPGSVGSCSETEKTFADFAQHCVNKGEALCRRARQRCLNEGMPVDTCNGTYISCTGPLVENCRMGSWSPACEPPTEAQAEACIDALLDPSTLSVPDADVNTRIAACAQLTCGGRGALIAPADASVPWTDGTEVP